MRKVMFLMATALIAGVAASFAVSASAATSPWFEVKNLSLQQVAPRTLAVQATVANVGTQIHTATVEVRIEDAFYSKLLYRETVKLAPPTGFYLRTPVERTWYGRVLLPKGTYEATITVAHVFEKSDPADLLGATLHEHSGAAVLP